MFATRSRKLLLAAPILLLAAGLLPANALAQSEINGQKDSVVGLYMTEASSRFTCNKIEPLACDDDNIKVTGELNTNYFVFLCVFKAKADLGVTTVQCGVRYDDVNHRGADVLSWTSCADLEYPQDGWPNRSGLGNTIVWVYSTNCQRDEPGGFGDGVTAVAGYFSMTAYSPDKFEITGGPQDKVIVVDCDLAESYPDQSNWGWVGFSDDESVKGSLPCLKRVTEESTWGGVKTLYNR